ncbi:MAG: hypothetical protein GXY83_37520 [Rhodopirellula sp.]|nr:hypothetical protein [Rhodopirellula sp.]
MKYVAIFHANLNYAYLVPEKYEFVIRASYELLIDTMREEFPETKYVFEASGYTLDHVAEKTPDVLDKLRGAIDRGQCELMGSPYAHPMLPNFPEEDGDWSIEFSLEAYDRLLGMRPRSFWNPECGWRGFVPAQVSRAGYRNLIGDFEAYSRSLTRDGKPQRPEIYAAEHSDDKAFYSFGFNYDLPGTERAIHFPFRNIADVESDTLRVFLRTDRVAQFGVRFFMGMSGYTLEKYLDLIRNYSTQPAGEAEGALIIFADDAEYVGTNGWFRLKYQNQPDHVFERCPDAREKLVALIRACNEMGGFATFDEACNTLPPLGEELTFDDDSAWHGAKASTWAETPMARLLRPWQDLVRQKLRSDNDLDDATRRRAWYHLTNSYNSDGQWPPTLPDAPHIIHPFNYTYCFDNLLAAELLIGGVDHGQLTVDPPATIRAILGPQQELVLRKAGTMAQSSDPATAEQGQLANALIRSSRDLRSIEQSAAGVLYPSEYRVRAENLVAARRLVGGIEIEKVETAPPGS